MSTTSSGMSPDDQQELQRLRTAVDDARAEVARIEGRLLQLEARASDSAWEDVPASSRDLPRTVPPSRPPITARPPRPPRRPREPSRFERDLRAFFTEGNPLNKIGAAFLLLGATILFKYAVDNDWIGPTGRVLLGLVTGAGLFALGEVYQRKAWRRFASGLVAAGQGLLFLSVFFGQQQYEIIPAPVAFGMYMLFTATAVAQSLRYDALGLAVWGLVGGYLTPFLASTGTGNFVMLSAYLLVLNTGVFAIAYHRNWQPLKWMAFLLTEPYVVVWVIAYLDRPGSTPWLHFHWLLPALWVFFIYFAAIPTWRSLIRREPIDVFGQTLTVLNGVVHFTLAIWLLYDEHRAWLGVVAIVVTVIYAVLSSLLVRQPVLDTKGLRVFAGTAAAFLVLATPFLATGSAITLVWCAETVFLAWACTQPRFGFLRGHVLVMLGIIAIRLVVRDNLLSPAWANPDTTYVPLMHLRSYPPLVAAITFGIVARFLGRVEHVRVPIPAVIALGLFVAVAALNGEASRVAYYSLARGAHGALQDAVRAGLLVTVCAGVMFLVLRGIRNVPMLWGTAFALTLLLVWLGARAIFWPEAYRHMLRPVAHGLGLWWLHGATVLLVPLILLLVYLAKTAPDGWGRFSRAQWQTVCGAAALVITLFLLRREIFAITHAPPLADVFPVDARRASYRMLLSLSYALLALGVYLSAVWANHRPRLLAAYALYVMTGLKVIFFDIEGANQLFRGISILIVGAILILSHYFAERQRKRYAD